MARIHQEALALEQLCGNGLGKEGRLRNLQDCDGVLTRHARKVRQKVVQRVPLFKIIDKSLHGDSGARKDGSPAQPIGRCGDQWVRDQHLFLLHGMEPSTK